jgi:peptidoglycan/LPS O-acetylase OafA/YrhL
MTTPDTQTPTATTGGRDVPLIRATAVTAVVALVVNVVLAATGVAVLDIGDGYDPLALTSVTVTTVLAVTASGVLLAVLQRRTSRPQMVFRVLVTVGALASLGGPLSLLGSDQYPQATGPVVAWTAMLHLTTAAAVLAILATRAGDRK